MKKRTNSQDLTDAEIAFLRSTNLDPEVKKYLSRQHENIGVKASAFRKIADAAAAETAALLAVRELGAVQGDLASLDEAKHQLQAAERRVGMLESAVGQKDAEIRRLTALPAMAEHSRD